MTKNFELFQQAPPEPQVWSVSQVNRAVRILLEGHVGPFWVSGEVGQWTRARSGHCYFTLKDEQAQLKAVMWRSDAQRLPIDPEEGTRVRAHGSLTLYESRGEFQFRAVRVTAEDGDGMWRRAMERLKAVLEAEGLLDPARKRALPALPRAVGVVTSVEGAALKDIVQRLQDRSPWLYVVVRGTRVQGEGAARSIARSVRVLGGSGLVDVLIVGRGGGSIEDLWAFNEEPVARAIAECPVPVVSAVGHEVDVTLADLVADVRAPTPSAAAELVTPDRGYLEELLRGLEERVREGLRGQVRTPLRALDRLAERLPAAVTRRLERRQHALASVAGRIEALSPLGALRRGFAVPLDQEGRLLRTVDDFSLGVAFRLRIRDGTVEAVTEQVTGIPEASP